MVLPFLAAAISAFLFLGSHMCASVYRPYGSFLGPGFFHAKNMVSFSYVVGGWTGCGHRLEGVALTPRVD